MPNGESIFLLKNVVLKAQSKESTVISPLRRCNSYFEQRKVII